MTAVVELERVTKRFGRGRITALSDVDLRVEQQTHVALLGASGAGKTTLARLVVGLDDPDRGRVLIDGGDLARLRGHRRRQVARVVHLVFQNAYAALPSWRRVADIVAEPLVIHRLATGSVRDDLVRAVLGQVGLGDRHWSRRPPELSGGELQRVALARAVVARPRLIIADEPTAMLDASSRAGLLETLAELRATHGIAVVHITHDIALAGAFCHRIVVLDEGRVVEDGPAAQVLTQPAHEATRQLLKAAATLHGL